MELTCLGSSSRGNCYLLAARSETLMIEAGVDFKEVKRAVGWKPGSICGCLVSHEHNDHAKCVPAVLASGIRTLALPSVFLAKGVAGNAFAKEIQPMKGYAVGGFRVFALPVAHDVPCLGFVIDHAEMGRTLFLTDTMMLEYRLPALDHVMIEANYSDEVLQANIDAGRVDRSMRQRLLRSHMELHTACGILAANDISGVQEVILLHLSDTNSDSAAFREFVERSCGKPAVIAEKGLSLHLNGKF